MWIKDILALADQEKNSLRASASWRTSLTFPILLFRLVLLRKSYGNGAVVGAVDFWVDLRLFEAFYEFV